MSSGTIKAMLSGPGQYAENESNEVHFREIPYVLFKKFICFVNKEIFNNFRKLMF